MLIVMMMSFCVYGQTDRYLYVYPKHASAYPVAGVNNGSTGNPQINQIFSDYSVNAYEKGFPGVASSSVIANAYSIFASGNIDNLASALWATGKFSRIHDVPAYEVASCPNPVYANDPEFVAHYNDPVAAQQVMWHLESIEAECAWSVTTGNPNITVAVIDTEFDETHPDLAANLIFSEPGLHGQGIHGTSVAGSASAVTNNNNQISGIGFNTTIAGYRVGAPHPNGSGNPSVSGSGIWVKVWQAFLDGRPVINVSWTSIGGGSVDFSDSGMSDINTQQEAAAYITENGSVLVLGGGNKPAHAGAHFGYANIPGVINVGWLERGNLLNDDLENGVPYTPYSDFIDLVAPSEFVRVISPGNQLSWSWGTSHGAPMVAGTAALMLDVNDCMTPREIEGILKNTAGVVANGDFAPHGTGRLLASEAVRFAGGYTTYINDTKVWTAPAHLSGDLIIESGGQLTIKDQIRVAPDAQIIIKPNGRLILDGGTLTNDCSGEKWDGIIVEGDRDESQDYNIYTQSRAQGYFRMKNNALIENALYGVRLYNPYDGLTDEHGGIIIATDSEFKNCTYGVDFAPYTNISFPEGNPKGNLSYFRKCTFSVDDFMIDDDNDFVSHISMRGITGLRVLACELSNDQTQMSQSVIEQRGFGIKALDSEFKVLPVCNVAVPQGGSCNDYTYSNFRGFATGILSGNKGGINTFRIDRTYFSANHFGVAGYSSDNCSITRCEFEVGLDFVTQDNPYTGLLLHGTAGFKVEENVFNGFDFTNSGLQSVGTVIRNSGNEINEVYKNYYNGLDFANVANGDNRGDFNNDGLKYLCNENGENEGNGYDFAVPSTSFLDSGIAEKQGSNSLPAGNTFSSNPLNPVTHFFNDLEDIDYFYRQGITEQLPTNYSIPEVSISGTTNNNTCSSKLPDDREREFANETEKNSATATMNSGTNSIEGSYAYSRLLRDLKADTVGIAYTDIRSMLRNRGDYEALCDLVDCYLQEKSALAAADVLDSIEIQLTLTTEETERFAVFDALKKMQIQAELNNTSLDDFISQNTTELDAIADEKYGTASVQALYLLKYVQIEHFGQFEHAKIILPEIRVEERSEDVETAETAVHSIYPNPAHDFVTFEHTLSESAKLSVFSSVGAMKHSVLLNRETGKTILNTKNFSTGIYFYLITTDSGISEKGKFVVLK